MSSPSPGPNLSGPAAVAGVLGGGSRRVSSSFMGSLASMPPTPTSQTIMTSRAMTPPTQQSPNSFLANLSSRILHSRSMANQYSGVNRGGLGDFLEATGMHVQSNSLLASFRANSSHANFGIPSSERGPPSALDLSEFPSLSGSVGSSFFGSSSGAPGSSRPAYVGMVKDSAPPSSSSSEFTILSEDFPALPGSNPNMHNLSHETVNPSSSNTGFSGLLGNTNVVSNSSQNISSSSINPGNNENCPGLGMNSSKSIKRGIQTSKEGRVTNIPPGMVCDQFGMIGLLTFIRATESNPNLVSLALGTDLTTLKLDLNSSENLYSTFSGPWSDITLKPHEIDYPVPHEYLINGQIREKLMQQQKIPRYGDDTLFFLFYMIPNDLLQLQAAAELYNREWRYHKDEKVWITRAPGMPPVEKNSTYERGTYYYFDAINWRRVAKEFHLDYDRLENRPVITTEPYSHYNRNQLGQQNIPTPGAL